MSRRYNDEKEEYAIIKEKGEIGFIDIESDSSIYDYDPSIEGPVTISVPFPLNEGKPQSALVGQTSKSSITLENTTDESIEIWGIRIYCSNPEDTFTLSIMEPPAPNAEPRLLKAFRENYSLEDRVLQPNQTLTIWLSCKPKDVGLHTSVVHFDVGDDRIERVAFLLADDPVSQSLASNRPYSAAPRRKQRAVEEYVPSQRPVPKNRTGKFWKVLEDYPIPKNARDLVARRKFPKLLYDGLTMENYGTFFSALLVIEELHLEDEMRRHNMQQATLRSRGYGFLSLEVPGLAEKRPSLVQGDHVFAKLEGDTIQFQGYIHHVEADEVRLKFSSEFHNYHRDSFRYDIHFTYNRVNMRRLYQAVEAAINIEDRMLFPYGSARRTLAPGTEIDHLPTSLNEEQANAVKMILRCKGAPPYVIYGPPGTGKTKTLVEAIIQVYIRRQNSRVLICAASNSAADNILERLTTNQDVPIKDNEIFRLNAMSRPYDDVPSEHLKYCYFDESIFKCPPLNALARYRIIISTYASSSQISFEGVERGHFSHIFLDEAGQASEPECMVPVANLCCPRTVVVLAGDPKQLGPVVFSKDAENFGLGKSFLVRLFECEAYRDQRVGFVTKLVRNYRSHPAILSLPSKLFYKSELVACKGDSDLSFEILSNKDFPVLFIGIQGCDEREGNNPSWFNRIEASKVVEVIGKLRNGSGLEDSQIGVITPYRQQVVKIRNVLENFEMGDIKVGSVEQFQGQEREVIIISTVRSTMKHNEFDKTYCLGFLSNPKRFNVAITRARSLLIIVGNPHIVSKDRYWNKLLKYCVENGSYQGCQLPEEDLSKQEDVSEDEETSYSSYTGKQSVGPSSSRSGQDIYSCPLPARSRPDQDIYSGPPPARSRPDQGIYSGPPPARSRPDQGIYSGPPRARSRSRPDQGIYSGPPRARSRPDQGIYSGPPRYRPDQGIYSGPLRSRPDQGIYRGPPRSRQDGWN